MVSERRGRGRAGGGREARRTARVEARPAIVPYVTRRVPVYDVMSVEGLELIEHNAETILEEIGVEFRDDAEALALWRGAGADIAGERVRIPRGLARKLVTDSAPAEFVQHARNPERSARIGGPHMVFAPAYGPPFIRSLDEGRRYATIEDFRNFVKLTYLSPGLHHAGGTLCEPVDLPVNKRHLDMVYSHLRYSDKPFMGSVTAPERAEDTVSMAKIVFGDAFVDANAVITSLINANSPLVWDATMLGALKVYARNNQATVVSPFCIAGAMSPVTIAATCAQLFAEALSGMAFTQLVRPGAPVIFGTFSSSMSMLSGAPTFGTPEPQLVLNVIGSLSRRLGVPFRSGGGLCASKLPDAQAAFESANTLQHAMLAGVNFMLHVAGWLEGGLAMGVREVRDGRRPGADDASVPRRHRSLGERPGARRDPRGRPRGATSSAPHTPARTSRPRSTARRSPTTTASSSGSPKAVSTARSEPTDCGRRCSRATRLRRSTRASTRRCGSSSTGKRRLSRT